jgi:aspartyl-tRNA(Asn)/glutamyl-tRNA(Gln) amidotransferase subunit A
MNDPADLTAVELTVNYRSGELSPVEATESVLERIDAWEPTLNALYILDADAARKAARASQERWRRGEPLGPLDGVPMTVKENIATRGHPIPLGSAATDPVPALEDALAPALLREGGTVLLGKTTMPEYGMLTSGVSSLHGVTRNPWDPGRTPGGSSAGAGAGAAAGYAPLHLGTDIGGSIRVPAAWCGVVGFKPSFGRIPVAPAYPGRTHGPLTRTVADAALFTSAVCVPDARDHLGLPPAAIDWQDLEREVAGLRIGLLTEAGTGMPVEPETAAAVSAAAAAFEAAGARVDEVAGPLLTRAMLDGLDRFWRARFWPEISAMPEDRRARMLDFIVRWAAGADGLTGTEVLEAYGQTDAMAVAAVQLVQRHDYVLSPVMPIAAFPADQASPDEDPEHPFEHITFTVPFNMSGQPAISVNCGWTSDGLPIGLQIVGHRFDDLGVLRVAAAYERLRPGQRPFPTPPPRRSLRPGAGT